MSKEQRQLSEALLLDMDKFEDFDVWVAAVGMVAIAGRRATTIKRWDINTACLKFVQEMSTLVGTPDFPPKGSTQ